MTNQAPMLFEELGLHTCQSYFNIRWLRDGITTRICVKGKTEPLTTINGRDWNEFSSEVNKNEINKAISNKYELKNIAVRLSLGFQSSGNNSEAWYNFVLNPLLREIQEGIPENSLFKTIKEVEIVFKIEKFSLKDFQRLKTLNSDAKKRIKELSGQKARFSFSLKMGKFVFDEELGKFVDNKEIEISENNREGWAKGAEAIKTTEGYLKKQNTTDAGLTTFTYSIFVRLSQDNDITNLRYFLPLWHYFKKRNRSCKLVLRVELDTENDLSEKVAQLFAVLPDVREEVVFNGRALRTKMDIGDLFPLICISQGSKQNDKLIEKYGELFSGYLSYVLDEDKYKGTTGNRLKEIEKKEIRDKLSQFLDKISINIADSNNANPKLQINKNIKYDNFNALLFLYLIKNHVDNKVIFIKDNTWVLNEDVLKKTWQDSKTYTEGLWQLIENAQHHSEGHVAYFGMRIYKTDLNESMSNIAKEAQTRDVLWRKYWAKQTWDDGKNEWKAVSMTEHKDRVSSQKTNNTDNIFNLRDPKTGMRVYSDFIEFYVLDDAIGDNGASGIIDKINSKHKFKKEIKHLQKIFELTENDYISEDESGVDFYIEHYGMRWLKSHVDRLKGIMEIYSPCSQAECDKKACCYSNVFENLEDATPYYKELYSTEYSILIPLENKQK